MTSPQKYNRMMHTERLLKLLHNEEQLSTEIRIHINERARCFLDGVVSDAERFLRDDLDYEKHTENEIRTLIQSVPDTLTMKNSDGMYPIQSITWDYSDDGFNAKAIPFLPVLADEGAKLNVGGDGMRGGVLIKSCRDEESDCVLEELISVRQCEDECSDAEKRKHIESLCLDAIKNLRELGLFEKDDIRRYNLLSKSCHPSSIDRFNYLVDWNPGALKEKYSFDGKWSPSLLSSVIVERESIENFEIALKAGLHHFPHALGFLFLKTRGEAHTLFRKASELYGKVETWSVVEECFKNMNHKEEVFEKAPFISIAKAVNTNELDVLYYILKHHPIVLERLKCNRKRKREKGEDKKCPFDMDE